MFFFPTFHSGRQIPVGAFCLKLMGQVTRVVSPIFCEIIVVLGKAAAVGSRPRFNHKGRVNPSLLWGVPCWRQNWFFVHSKVVVDSVSLSSWLHMWARMCKVVIPIRSYLWHGSFAGQCWYRWLPHLGSTYSQVSILPSPHFFTHWLHIAGSSSMWSVARCAWIISLESLCATSTRISPASPATIWKKWPQRGTGPCQRWVHPLFYKTGNNIFIIDF